MKFPSLNLNLFKLVAGVITTSRALAVGALTATTGTFTGAVSMLTASAGIPRVELPDGGTLTTQQCRGSLVCTKGQDDDALIALPAIFEGANLMLVLEVKIQ